MADSSTPTVVLEGLAFPEGPRWHDGSLWFSDMHAHEVIALDPSGATRTVARAPEGCSGLGWLPDGRLLVVSMESRQLLVQDPDGALSVHADLADIATFHCNDMVVDGQGRAYVGNFGYDLNSGAPAVPADMARVDPDGSVHVAATDLLFPNGSVIVPDGGTLIVAETGGARLTAFDIAADGQLTNRRVWAETPGRVPDGICLDAEGAVWVASPLTNEVIRVREGGEVADCISTGDHGAFACMLGGDDRSTLYICTSTTFEPERCMAERSGRIESVTVTVPGAGWP